MSVKPVPLPEHTRSTKPTLSDPTEETIISPITTTFEKYKDIFSPLKQISTDFATNDDLENQVQEYSASVQQQYNNAKFRQSLMEI